MGGCKQQSTGRMMLKVFAAAKVQRMEPDPGDAEGFKRYRARYEQALAAERAAAAVR